MCHVCLLMRQIGQRSVLVSLLPGLLMYLFYRGYHKILVPTSYVVKRFSNVAVLAPVWKYFTLLFCVQERKQICLSAVLYLQMERLENKLSFMNLYFDCHVRNSQLFFSVIHADLHNVC